MYAKSWIFVFWVQDSLTDCELEFWVMISSVNWSVKDENPTLVKSELVVLRNLFEIVKSRSIHEEVKLKIGIW